MCTFFVQMGWRNQTGKFLVAFADPLFTFELITTINSHWNLGNDRRGRGWGGSGGRRRWRRRIIIVIRLCPGQFGTDRSFGMLTCFIGMFLTVGIEVGSRTSGFFRWRLLHIEEVSSSESTGDLKNTKSNALPFSPRPCSAAWLSLSTDLDTHPCKWLFACDSSVRSLNNEREKGLIGYSEAMEGIYSSDLFCRPELMEFGEELTTTSIATKRPTWNGVRQFLCAHCTQAPSVVEQTTHRSDHRACGIWCKFNIGS